MSDEGSIYRGVWQKADVKLRRVSFFRKRTLVEVWEGQVQRSVGGGWVEISDKMHATSEELIRTKVLSKLREYVAEGERNRLSEKTRKVITPEETK